MNDVFPKFIVEGNNLIIGKVTYHKDLVTDKTQVKGGGFWNWNKDKKEFILSGDSYDFGRATAEDIKSCIDAGNVFFSFIGGRKIEDHTFLLDTRFEIIKLK